MANTTKKDETKKVVKTDAVKADVAENTDDKKKSEYLYSVGKRKTAVAQVRVYKKGKGSIKVNDKDLNEFFTTFETQDIVTSPLKIIGQADKLDVTVRVVGGGVIGQAEATRNGLAKALIQLNPNFRKPLKKAGFIKRDARKKERKKPGLKRARRAPQWKKR